MTANLIDHPSPTSITEGLDMRPGIVDDYGWLKATAKIHQEASPYKAKPIVKVSLNKKPQAITWKAFDPAHPAPDINTATHNHFHTAPFGVLLNDEVCGLFCKGIRPHKFFRLMGEPSNLHPDNKWTDDQSYDRMKWRVPTTTLRWATQTLFLSDHERHHWIHA
jgi:hypothetical protein